MEKVFFNCEWTANRDTYIKTFIPNDRMCVFVYAATKTTSSCCQLLCLHSFRTHLLTKHETMNLLIYSVCSLRVAFVWVYVLANVRAWVYGSIYTCMCSVYVCNTFEWARTYTESNQHTHRESKRHRREYNESAVFRFWQIPFRLVYSKRNIRKTKNFLHVLSRKNWEINCCEYLLAF